MKRLRSHIIRLTVVLLISSGFSLYVVQPTQARHSTNAFANWLSKMTKASNGADLQHELENLRKSGGHLDKVIEKASRIISRNNEGFVFSFGRSMASQQLYQLLLIEWNQFQTDNAMSSIPLQQTVKTPSLLQTEKSPFVGSASLLTSGITMFPGLIRQFLGSMDVIAYSLVPMVDCIAIGAP